MTNQVPGESHRASNNRVGRAMARALDTGEGALVEWVAGRESSEDGGTRFTRPTLLRCSLRACRIGKMSSQSQHNLRREDQQ